MTITPPRVTPPLGVGFWPNLRDDLYYGDPCEAPSLSCSLAKTLISESCLHGFYQHQHLLERLCAQGASV